MEPIIAATAAQFGIPHATVTRYCASGEGCAGYLVGHQQTRKQRFSLRTILQSSIAPEALLCFDVNMSAVPAIYLLSGLIGWGGWSISWFDFMIMKEHTNTVEIGNVRADHAPAEFWLRENDSITGSERWILSSDCPAVLGVLQSLQQVKFGNVLVPGLSKGGRLVPDNMDNPTYTLRLQVRTHYNSSGAVRLMTRSDKAIVFWFEKTMASLKPCWKADKPVFKPAL